MSSIPDEDKGGGTLTPMGSLLRTFFSSLEKRRIRYCVLRNYEGLPDSTTHDVDLLVDPRRAQECAKLLASLGTEAGWHLVRASWRCGMCWLFLIKPQSIAQRTPVLRVDLVWTSRYWRGVPCTSVESVLAASVRHDGIRVASPGGEAAVTLAKEYLHNGDIGPDEKLARNRARVLWGVRNDRATFVRALSKGFGSGLAHQLADRISAEDWGWFPTHASQVRARVLVRCAARRPLQQCVAWVRYLAGQFPDRLLQPSGLMVALFGPDGSGKTTVARAVEREILGSVHDAFPRVTCRHGRFGLLPTIKDAYNRLAHLLRLPIRRELTTDESTRLLDGPPYHPLRAVAYLAYYTLDYLLGHAFIWRERVRAHIILFDRYYYDYLVHSTFDRVPWALRKTLLRLVPQSQLVIYLKGDPEVIHARKPELRPEQIAEQQRRCELIIRGNPRALTCPSDVPLEETTRIVVDALLAAMERQATSKPARWSP